ncbi:MAG: DUF4286 family protein [Planctomycetota bacterium]|nr:DUF4286 family protein [Planctomycetota bacterium]
MARSILYMVTATIPDEKTARDYIAWLEDGHVDQVVDGGAHSGMIVRLEGEPIRVETHYVFATRQRFDDYVKKHAPALRADGLKRFPPESGITFERRIGEIY